jgi:hypothetical protein
MSIRKRILLGAGSVLMMIGLACVTKSVERMSIDSSAQSLVGFLLTWVAVYIFARNI